MQVTMTVNGEQVTREVEARTLLVHFLRDTLALTGTHWGCDTSNCGTCVVWVDEQPVKSCTMLAAMAGGRRVRTVEGPGAGRRARPGAAGLHGLPRPPVRLLHPGDDDDRPVAARPQPRPHRGRDPRGDLRSDLPVHRIQHHRALGALGRDPPARRRAGRGRRERGARRAGGGPRRVRGGQDAARRGRGATLEPGGEGRRPRDRRRADAGLHGAGEGRHESTSGEQEEQS